MSRSAPDAASRLAWALKRYWLLLVLPVIAFAVLAAVSAPPPATNTTTYEARALLAAADLGIRPEQFPRTITTIFGSGDVAEDTVAQLGLDIEPADLIPDVLDVEPVADTVLIAVTAVDPDPARAAEIANVAAVALLAELNILGDGFGSFLEVAPARPPQDAQQPETTGLPVPLAAIAGVLFGGGLVGLVLTLRRPVLTPAEAAETVGVPVMGTFQLDMQGELPPVEQVPGLAATVKSVLPERPGTVAFVSIHRDADERSATALLFARALARQGPVSFVYSGEGHQPEPERNLAISDHIGGIADLDDIPVVIDGLTSTSTDIPQFIPGRSKVVLVIAEGAPEEMVREAASQFLEGELTGIVFVRAPDGLNLMAGFRRARKVMPSRGPE